MKKLAGCMTFILLFLSGCAIPLPEDTFDKVYAENVAFGEEMTDRILKTITTVSLSEEDLVLFSPEVLAYLEEAGLSEDLNLNYSKLLDAFGQDSASDFLINFYNDFLEKAGIFEPYTSFTDEVVNNPWVYDGYTVEEKGFYVDSKRKTDYVKLLLILNGAVNSKSVITVTLQDCKVVDWDISVELGAYS